MSLPLRKAHVVQDRLDGEAVYLRPLGGDDITTNYLGWLNDPEVNRFLETRHRPQTMQTIREFVERVNTSDDAFLFGIFEICLETNQVVQAAGEIILSQLHNRMGTLARARISKSHRAHWAKCQRIKSTLGDDLDGQAPFEEMPGLDTALDRLFKGTQLDPLGV